MRLTRIGLVAAAVLGAGVAAAPAQSPEQPIALVTTYADGRVTESLVGPNGFRAWTPSFPRFDDWTPPGGSLPITALNVAATRDGEVLRVRVSVLRGASREVDDVVAEAVVGLGDAVVIEDLRRVGVQPVTLSAKLFAPPALHVPRMRSQVPGLAIEGVEPTLDPVPQYVVSLRNETDVPIVTIAYSTCVQGRPSLSGQEGDFAARPFIAPGESATFRIRVASAREVGRAVATADPLDDVVIAGAIFADGRIAGDRSRMATLLALHRGRLAAVERVIAVMRTTPGGDSVNTLHRLRETIAALPVAAEAAAVATVMGLVPDMSPYAAEGVSPAISTGSQNVRQRLLADIDRLLPIITSAEASQWLAEALPACEAWRSRLAAMFALR